MLNRVDGHVSLHTLSDHRERNFLVRKNMLQSYPVSQATHVVSLFLFNVQSTQRTPMN